MKLDNKRTILTGFAFLSICAFWQMYNSIVPLILTNTFHLNETYSGAIMAADNIVKAVGAYFVCKGFVHVLYLRKNRPHRKCDSAADRDVVK